MKLLYFDLTQGNFIGSKVILKRFGLKGIPIIARLKTRELLNNPFKALNKLTSSSENERLSQRQMAPLVILYQILQEDGMTKEEALSVCSKVSKEVAVAFLNFSIPTIKKSDWEGESKERKISMLNKIAKQFFNMQSINELKPNDEFTISVKTCSFASYSKQLGVPELGSVFCAADRYYFENFQPEVQFGRTQTLAENNLPCDFNFKWKQK